MSMKEDIHMAYVWKGTENTTLHVLYQGDVCLCSDDRHERIATCNRDELITFIKDLKEGGYAQ